MKSKYFEVGQIVLTAGVFNETVAESNFGYEVLGSLRRHCDKDWGELCEEDAALNDEAIATGEGRIFSAYKTCKGKIWIVTEADRSVTTILFPCEY